MSGPTDEELLEFLREQAAELRRRPEGYTDGEAGLFDAAVARFAELAKGGEVQA
jgi:hypothetical protein